MRPDQFQRQAEFTDRYVREKRPSTNLVELTKEYVLSLHREVDEVLDEVPWKGHRAYESSEVVRSNIAEEIIDVIKYAMGLAHLHGLTYDDLVTEFDVKSDVVEDRWRQDHGETAFREGESPIVLLDLDGVLNTYPEPFLDFVNSVVLGGHGEWNSIERLEREDPELKLRAKHAYRQSGIKRVLPPRVDSVLAAQMLAAAGYAIVIMSQRPYGRYKRIYGDTLHWLRQHEVPFDRLLFVPDKQHNLVLAPYLDRIAFAVDDDLDVVRKLRLLGIVTYQLGADVKSMLQIPAVIAAQTEYRRKIRGDEADQGDR